MAAFFADIDEEQHFKKGTNSLPTARPPEIEVLNRRDRERFDWLNAQLEKMGKDECNAELVTELKAEKEQLESGRRKTMICVSLEKPREIRILPRGNFLDDSGPVVSPAVPEFLGELQTEGRATRLDLANWLVDPKEGVGLLTARVLSLIHI